MMKCTRMKKNELDLYIGTWINPMNNDEKNSLLQICMGIITVNLQGRYKERIQSWKNIPAVSTLLIMFYFLG